MYGQGNIIFIPIGALSSAIGASLSGSSHHARGACEINRSAIGNGCELGTINTQKMKNTAGWKTGGAYGLTSATLPKDDEYVVRIAM